MNEAEAEAIAGVRGPEAGDIVRSLHAADVVVVKRGCSGARVHRSHRPAVSVPAYISGRVFKIGSGDVFSAAFAHHWAEKGFDAVEAADIASRAASRYVESRSLPLDLQASDDLTSTRGEPGRIYLAGPFFDIAQRWLIEEARTRLIDLGASVFSPFHDVGTVGGAQAIAAADLAGLDGCDAVLALVDSADPGTIFEVGHARVKGIPVVALAERLGNEHLTMLSGTGCSIVEDLASALYHAVWASMR
ncbi:PfkB family carbohydrate kinase [Methylobacterium sp. Leaf465]|uniref:PfkB family carbohydrate kinase n=1 Tax=Methylobacterium sp. Leaf465 TaxID=1736385 RepID=UPI001FCDF49D|nr:PfkB family carbohydrate kinase [Methylobacterium sp. Leaf465]